MTKTNGLLLADGSWEVELDLGEMMNAGFTGVQRHVQSLSRGEQDRAKLKDDDAGWNKDCNGAAGELAFAKFRNMHWDSSVNTYTSRPDVQNFEVRTRTKHEWDLMVRPRDKDDAYYVHVTGRPPTFRIHGFMKGSDAKQFDPIDHGNYGKPAHFVPAVHLERFVP